VRVGAVVRSAGSEPGVSHPRTPVEYLRQDEKRRCTLPGAQAIWHQSPEQGFTLRGHRLSSLYRIADQATSQLIQGKSGSASSCQKYSNSKSQQEPNT